MGSNDRDVQLAQIERTEQELAARIATLNERGLSEEKVERDRVVRHLRSTLGSLKNRVTTIDELEKRKKAQAERKAAKAAEAKKPKKKGKKKAEEPPPQQGKGKKKNKKKKS